MTNAPIPISVIRKVHFRGPGDRAKHRRKGDQGQCYPKYVPQGQCSQHTLTSPAGAGIQIECSATFQ